MAHHISIHPATGVWVVRAGGAVLGETHNALALTEGGMPPVIYFPRADIAMAFLEPSATMSTCPHKGEASYFSIITKSTTLHDAGWSYQDPAPAVAQIKDHLAFYEHVVAVEQL